MKEKTKEERALGTLIHDHAGNSGAIKTAVHLLRTYIKDNNVEKIEQYLQYITQRSKDCDGALDNYYIKFKNNFNESDNNV